VADVKEQRNHFAVRAAQRPSLAVAVQEIDLGRHLPDIRSCLWHGRAHSTTAPPLRLRTVPVIPLAWSDAINAAALPSSPSLARRPRCVMLPIRERNSA